MLRIEAIDHVVLRVRELAPMLRFYSEVLGCREERRVEELGLYQLRAGDSLIDLVTCDGPLGREDGGPPGQGRNMAHLCLRLAEFDAEALSAHLRAQGIDAGEPADRYGAHGSGPSLYIRDPEGNTIELKGPPNQPPLRGSR